MIYIRRIICAAVATVAIASAAPVIAQEHDQHSPPASSAQPSAPKTCPMMGKPMDRNSPEGAGSEMPQHMADMHQMMQHMSAEMQAMRSEMAQLRQEMQRRR
jgi:hypothetical protein